MIHLTKTISCEDSPQATLTLPFANRTKSRLRTSLDDGRAAGLFLERGQVLEQGDLLSSEDGMIVEVIAAQEKVSVVRCDNPLLMAKACYHLGNRHVPLQINAGRLQYLHDHVLDNMLVGLGLTVQVEMVPFQPGSGAYSNHGHRHH